MNMHLIINYKLVINDELVCNFLFFKKKWIHEFFNVLKITAVSFFHQIFRQMWGTTLFSFCSFTKCLMQKPITKLHQI